jgi:hypothetical protein
MYSLDAGGADGEPTHDFARIVAERSMVLLLLAWGLRF